MPVNLNTANRIHLSEAAKDALEKDTSYVISCRGEVQIKVGLA